MNDQTVSLTVEGVVKNYNSLVQLVNENFELKSLLSEYRQIIAELKAEAETKEVAPDGKHKQSGK